MAIEIIRAGTRRQVECGNCGALLRYSPEDVSHRTGSTYEPPRFTTRWIKCPQCNQKVVLPVGQ